MIRLDLSPLFLSRVPVGEALFTSPSRCYPFGSERCASMTQFAAVVAQNVVSEQLNNYISSSRKRGPGHLVGALPDESLAGQEQIKRHVGTMKEFLDDEQARVLTIYGVRGIGKMTLLKKFNDDLVESDAVRRRVYDKIFPSNGRRRRFDHVIFIHVSRSPNIENIKRDIEEHVGIKTMHNVVGFSPTIVAEGKESEKRGFEQ